ncbi:hypothetical protein THAOC_01649, partial [Thalassiosira oceanica]
SSPLTGRTGRPGVDRTASARSPSVAVGRSCTPHNRGDLRVVLSPKHDTNVRRVLPRRVEVRVVPDRRRQVERRSLHRLDRRGAQSRIVAKPSVWCQCGSEVRFAGLGEEQTYEAVPNGHPRRSGVRHERVEGGLAEDYAGMELDRTAAFAAFVRVAGFVFLRVCRPQFVEQACLGQQMQIDDVIPNGGAAPRRGRGQRRARDGRLEGAYPEGYVVEAEVALGRHVEPRFRGHFEAQSLQLRRGCGWRTRGGNSGVDVGDRGRGWVSGTQDASAVAFSGQG